MKQPRFFSRIRAAHGLAAAFEQGRTPSERDLIALDLPLSFKDRFKR